MASSIERKIAIITGASNGIGLVTVKLFLDASWSVLGVDMAPAPESISSPAFKFLQLNLCDKDAPSKIVGECKSAFGSERIDALCNVAGIMDNFQSARTVTDDVWEKVMNINLGAPVRLMREVLKAMQAQTSGNIVNVVSKAAMSGAVAGVAYTASKHALLGVTKNTAWMFRNEGIRCNAIAPGGTATNISASMDQTRVDMAGLAQAGPVIGLVSNMQTGEGMMSPDCAARAIFFLASDSSKGMNGVILPVDNGWSVI